MSCSFAVTLGKDPDQEINFGESIRRKFRYPDDVSLDDAAPEILQSDPPIIKEAAVLTVEEDDEGAYIMFSLDHANAMKLRRLGTNWFVLFVTFGGGTDDATPRIGIWVQ